MSERKINIIAEDLANHIVSNANPLNDNGQLLYYFSGSVATTLLSCNAVTMQDYSIELGKPDNLKVSIGKDVREIMQNHFLRPITDIDIITLEPSEVDTHPLLNFAYNPRNLNSIGIHEAIPDIGELCRKLAGNADCNNYVDYLNSNNRVITHCVSRITTEQGNSFYVVRPDYQLGAKMGAMMVYMQDFKKNLKDISVMFMAFSKLYTNHEILKAFQQNYNDYSVTYGDSFGVESSFKWLAGKMSDFLKRNIPNSEDAVNRLQEITEYIDKAPKSVLETLHNGEIPDKTTCSSITSPQIRTDDVL